jgi:capsular exopolysaccharide synthesis family protein
MSKGAPNPLYGPAAGGTSLVDRMNLSIHLRKYVKILARRFWIVLLCLAGGSGYAIYKAKTTPDVFESKSFLGMEPEVKTVYDPQVIVQLRAEFAELQLQNLQTVKSRVNAKMADYKSPNGLAFAPQAISATPGTGAANTFVLTVRGPEFEMVQQYAKLWAEEFVKYQAEQSGSVIDSSSLETQNEIKKYERLLEKSRADMDEFRRKNRIGNARDVGQSAEERLNTQMSELNAVKNTRQILENQSAEEVAESLLKQKESRSSSKTSNFDDLTVPQVEGYNPADRFSPESQVNQMDFALRRRKAELEDWSTKLLPEHPFLQKIQKDVEGMERDLKIQKDIQAEKRKEWLEAVGKMQKARIEFLRKQESALSTAVEDLRAEVLNLSTLKDQYKKLEEDQNRYKDYLDRQIAKRNSLDQMNGGKNPVNVMEKGTGNPAPVAPDRPKIILNGVMGGLAMGLAIVFLLHRLDDRLELAEDIEEELEEPVLGQIPQEDKNSLRDGRLLLTNLDEHNMFAESIRGVRSAILFGNPDQPKKTIITTSAVPGDGKTTFTVNFAATMANAGNRVLLVACDLRRGNVNGYFKLPRDPGLTEVLSGQIHWSDVVHDTEVPGLKAISTGRLPSNPGELLISPAMEEFVKEAREEYDHILFDCPPLTAIDDTFCLLNLADGMLFVVKAGQTSMRFAKSALSLVRQRGAHIFGVVLNGITTDHPSYYYNYYYHAYYRSAKDSEGAENSVRPAKKMATRSRRRIHSIETQAHAQAGSELSPEEIAVQEHKKAESFKARRAQKQSQGTESTGDAPPASDLPAPGKPDKNL